MTRVLLVDAGGVLFNNITEETGFVARLAEHHRADAGLLRKEIDGRDYDYEVDARHVYDVLTDCLVKAGATTRTIDRAWTDALYLDCLRPYPAVFECLELLRANRPDLRLALANNEAAHFDDLKNQRYGHLGLFHVVGSSWRVRAVKPGETYFRELLRVCDCEAADALLIDDNPEVVAGAAEYGIPTLHVVEPGGLADQLRSRGIGF